ncbi:MAG: hypothetical protein HOE44_00620 [Candidatus Marinimicrobia bacterium]|jgi:hypothetical protein|nr:hypothetical protein [Candidatus Neomarinimicrobiota bacterium]
MALQVNKPAQDGRTFSYHKLGKVKIDATLTIATGEIWSYVDLSTRESNDPTKGVTRFKLTALAQTGVGIHSWVYEALKLLPEWSGAIDV